MDGKFSMKGRQRKTLLKGKRCKLRNVNTWKQNFFKGKNLKYESFLNFSLGTEKKEY